MLYPFKPRQSIGALELWRGLHPFFGKELVEIA
jgi:hypothetical protein